MSPRPKEVKSPQPKKTKSPKPKVEKKLQLEELHGFELKGTNKIDDMDRKIIAYLSRDARISNREIAQALGIVEGTVRGRIKRLQQKNIIRIMPVTTILEEQTPLMAYIGIRAEIPRLKQAAMAVSELPYVRFVATLLGRYDILGICVVSSGTELVDRVNHEIIAIPGVRHVETTIGVKSLKYDYRWGRIVPH